MLSMLQELKDRLAEVADLNGAQAVLGWDQQTYMPEGGSESRGEQQATLARIAHDRFTDPRIGELLEKLAVQDPADPDADDARLVKVARREYTKAVKVPAEWVAEFARATALAQDAWVSARAEADFARFQPHLEKIVALRRSYASFFKPYQHIYDPLLDDFEPGLKTQEVQQIFSVLRKEQVELIRRISARPQVDDAFVHAHYDYSKQRELGELVITRFGYDWKCGRLDTAPHPFSTTFGYGDVRITTRFLKDNGVSSLFSSMHESGHAMYEQGIPARLRRSPLFNGTSMAVHESQSRMWENLVGRSFEFWTWFYPTYQAAFPEHLGSVSLAQFYQGINKVTPSTIRVEADEATYNLHVMLRMEIEIALMEGTIAVGDLPSFWNSRMQEYLGITPPDDAQGVLQDVHWSGGSIGYFPTYALGNLVSVQLWEKILDDLPGLPGQLAQGQFSSLLAWLREKVHVHGAKYEPQELIERVTGSRITPQPYLAYLKRKYSAIYNL